MANITMNDILRRERRPMHVFLSLAPTTSESYPTAQKPAPAVPQTPRRSSSQSSDGKEAAQSLRFLKLGPVHWGEHADDHKGDFHEVE